MSTLGQLGLFSGPTLLLIAGAVMLYVASRACVDALVRGNFAARHGWAAVGHWIPVAAVALMAAAAGRGEIAMGVVFGTSVAALSLAFGLITYMAPPGELPPSRRVWPFLLPAALLPLVAGFSGHLNAIHAVMIAVLGLSVLQVWRGVGRGDRALSQRTTGAGQGNGGTVADVLAREVEPAAFPEPEGHSRPPTLDYVTPPPGAGRATWDRETLLRGVQGLLAVALAGAGARAAVLGAVQADAASKLARAEMLAAAALSPLLILPVLGTGTESAQRGRSADACGALVALSLLNLCGLLPAVILFWYLRTSVPDGAGWGLAAAIKNLPAHGRPMPLPLAVWRVDAVLLTVLGFALIPVALGRWTLGRLESAGLIIAYAAYLAVTAVASLRW
jgi:Ca2+/Na+ antiporter